MIEKMNALRNKKGFTLIEMLVVIAIIAVLVAIAIPTVTGGTDKAACAANAANLRSIKAEVATAYLTKDTAKYNFGDPAPTGENAGDFTVTPVAGVTFPEFKETKTPPYTPAENDLTISYDASAGDFIVSVGGFDIDDFAKGAEGKYQASQNP